MDFPSDYKYRLKSINLLHLIYHYDLLDISFLINYLQTPDTCFPVREYISFSSSIAGSSSSFKRVHQLSKSNISHQSYFSRVARLRNTLPPVDILYHFILSTLNSCHPLMQPLCVHSIWYAIVASHSLFILEKKLF